MISQRRFKAIVDYPSKFDWPGIKGLKHNTPQQEFYTEVNYVNSGMKERTLM